jgi:hypothetical protein
VCVCPARLCLECASAFVCLCLACLLKGLSSLKPFVSGLLFRCGLAGSGGGGDAGAASAPHTVASVALFCSQVLSPPPPLTQLPCFGRFLVRPLKKRTALVSLFVSIAQASTWRGIFLTSARAGVGAGGGALMEFLAQTRHTPTVPMLHPPFLHSLSPGVKGRVGGRGNRAWQQGEATGRVTCAPTGRAHAAHGVHLQQPRSARSVLRSPLYKCGRCVRTASRFQPRAPETVCLGVWCVVSLPWCSAHCMYHLVQRSLYVSLGAALVCALSLGAALVCALSLGAALVCALSLGAALVCALSLGAALVCALSLGAALVCVLSLGAALVCALSLGAALVCALSLGAALVCALSLGIITCPSQAIGERHMLRAGVEHGMVLVACLWVVLQACLWVLLQLSSLALASTVLTCSPPYLSTCFERCRRRRMRGEKWGVGMSG